MDSMKREEALKILHQYVKKEQLIHHMLCVEAAMCFYAGIYHQDIEFWSVCGLLHDFDYEIHPTLERHPQDGAEILRSHLVPEAVIETILSHADHTGIPRDNLVKKALFACDEVTGLITACALVRPSKSVMDLEVKSVKKKWNNRQFAAGANREEIAQGAAEFGIDLWEHVENVIQAMRGIADQVALDGSLLV